MKNTLYYAWRNKLVSCYNNALQMLKVTWVFW